MLDKVKLGTFDLSPDVLEAIDQGKMLFAIDQQQYLQGYLPIVLLKLHKLYGLMPAGTVMTGPGFVTQENAGAGDRAVREGHPLGDAHRGPPLRAGPAGATQGRRAVAATRTATADERVARTPLSPQADGPARARRRGRDDPGLHLLRHRRRRQRPVLGAGHHQLPRGLGPARHHRGRGLAADDRRRVRPLDRLDDRRRRHDHRDPGRAVGLAALALHPARLRDRLRDRLRQRPDRDRERPAVVHRHAGRPVHPARPDHRLHPLDHRPHPGLRAQGAGRAGLAGAAVRRRGRRHG